MHNTGHVYSLNWMVIMMMKQWRCQDFSSGGAQCKYIFKQYSPVQTNMAEAKKSGGAMPPKTATVMKVRE